MQIPWACSESSRSNSIQQELKPSRISMRGATRLAGVRRLICTATFILVPVVVARIALGLLALLLGWIVTAVWMARKDELVVNAREI
jgi:hypothetical protein